MSRIRLGLVMAIVMAIHTTLRLAVGMEVTVDQKPAAMETSLVDPPTLAISALTLYRAKRTATAMSQTRIGLVMAIVMAIHTTLRLAVGTEETAAQKPAKMETTLVEQLPMTA